MTSSVAWSSPTHLFFFWGPFDTLYYNTKKIEVCCHFITIYYITCTYEKSSVASNRKLTCDQKNIKANFWLIHIDCSTYIKALTNIGDKHWFLKIRKFRKRSNRLRNENLPPHLHDQIDITHHSDEVASLCFDLCESSHQQVCCSSKFLNLFFK